MKCTGSPAGRHPAPIPLSALPYFFCCQHRRDGRAHYNFPAAVAGPTLRPCSTWTRGLQELATSILLISHPDWIAAQGRRKATGLARTLACPFAREYLIPNAGLDWIISSSTVREFAADALGLEMPLGTKPGRALNGPRNSRPRGVATREPA